MTKHNTVDLIALFSQGVSYFFLHHLHRNNVLSCSFFQQFPLYSAELISSCWRGPSWMLCFSHHWAQGRKRREAGGGKLYLCSFSEGCLTLWLSEDISSMWDSSSVFFLILLLLLFLHRDTFIENTYFSWCISCIQEITVRISFEHTDVECVWIYCLPSVSFVVVV